MPIFEYDGLKFRYRESGAGVPFFVQHGLGGDIAQPFGLVAPPDGFRMLAFDCRGHGETRPLGDESKLSLGAFADDLVALMDHLDLERAIIGGISMGAAVALNAALRYPHRAMGLILSRPAWVDEPFPPNVRVYPEIAAMIREFGAANAKERFKQSPFFVKSPRGVDETMKSLIGQFDDRRAEDAVCRLELIPRDAPSVDRSAWSAIQVPTLVMANRMDSIHPFEFGEQIAAAIPCAVFREITPKAVSFGRHADDVLNAVTDFLTQNFAFQAA